MLRKTFVSLFWYCDVYEHFLEDIKFIAKQNIVALLKRKKNNFIVGQILHGQLLNIKTELFGEVISAGSAASDILIECTEASKR